MANWKGENGDIADDIDHCVREPERFAVDAFRMFDCLVPYRSNRQALEDCRNDEGDVAQSRKRNPNFAEQTKSLIDEDAEIETEKGDSVQCNNDLI